MALDCSKATSKLDKIICSDDDLKQDDAEMEKAYFSLRKKLDSVGHAKLLKMQRFWLKSRSPYTPTDTLSTDFQDHTAFLKNTPKGMVPFLNTIKIKKFTRNLKGYEFSNPSTPAQKTFNKKLYKAISQSIGETDGRGGEDIDALDIFRNDKLVISARVYTDGFYGGAHPLHSAVHINIDTKTGKPLSIKSLFSKQTQKKIAIACAVQISDFRGLYEKDTPLEIFNAINEDYPNSITDRVKDATSWQFKKSESTIIFNEYLIASYTAGEQQCSFENTFLAPLSKRPEFFK